MKKQFPSNLLISNITESFVLYSIPITLFILIMFKLCIRDIMIRLMIAILWNILNLIFLIIDYYKNILANPSPLECLIFSLLLYIPLLQ